MAAFFLAVAMLLLGAVVGMLTADNPGLSLPVGILAGVSFGVAFLLNIRSVRAVVPFARTKEDRDDILRRELAKALVVGQQFEGELAGLQAQLDKIESARQRAEVWAAGIRDLLDRERPGWSAVFFADVITPQYMSQYGARDTVRNWLEQRRRALRDLLVRLG